ADHGAVLIPVRRCGSREAAISFAQAADASIGGAGRRGSRTGAERPISFGDILRLHAAHGRRAAEVHSAVRAREHVRIVRDDDDTPAGDYRSGIERRRDVGRLRIPVQAGGFAERSTVGGAVSAEARLADVVRGAGELPELAVVREFSGAAFARLAAGV